MNARGVVEARTAVGQSSRSARIAAVGVLALAAMMPMLSFAGIVAKWDFNNYDPANPTATNVLEATVGGDGRPCYYVGKGTALVTDGSLGQMYVIAEGSTDPLFAADTTAEAAAANLGAGNYAIAIPMSSHIALPIPNAVKNHAWTMKIRFYSPAECNNKYRSLFNRTNTTDGDFFISKDGNTLGFSSSSGYKSASNNYKTVAPAGSWHTLTISAGAQRFDVFLDESTEALYKNAADLKDFFSTAEALTAIDGVGYLLLCADEDGEDNLMYIDYVELYDEASVYEGKLPHYTKAGLTGEWTFPADNITKATVGRDLVAYTRTGASSFAAGADGVLPGDGHVNVGRNNCFKCYHGLASNMSYTVVMDVRVPDNANKTKTWHAIFKGTDDNNDADVFITYQGNPKSLKIRTVAENMEPMGIDFGEWARIAIAYENDTAKTVYVNGRNLCRAVMTPERMKTTKGGCFLLLGDNDGEDYDIDISYAAVYDRVLTDAEIAELHARPLAQRADGTFMPTVAPAGVWKADGADGLAASAGMPLEAAANGGWTWTRDSAPAAATYVADLALPATQTDGGVFVKNAAGVASGVYGTGSKYSGSFTTTADAGNFLGNTEVKAWGYWTLNALDRAAAHRVAVVRAANGRVHYYVDGHPWGQIFPANANTSAAPSATMTFFEGLGATVTRLAAYDAPLTPDEIAALGGAGSSPAGAVAPNMPTVSATLPAGGVHAFTDAVSFTVSATHGDGAYISYAIDFGDGTGESATALVPSGASFTFTHTYTAVGTFTPRVKAFSQDGAESAWVSAAALTVQQPPPTAAKDVLLTWPYQQNVYTNRFTIMCETAQECPCLEVQYGAGYTQRAAMTHVVGNGGTCIYKAHITVDDAMGATIPYRLGILGEPLTYTTAAENTEGVVKLWDEDPNASFSCAVWGDNQQGCQATDWGSNKFQFLASMFEHMVARGVDFGISSGDMASNAYYANEIRPCILDTTDAILGRTRPYYVAWGNHDTQHPATKPYFETGAVDEADYGSSDSGNYYLYRNNVLFVFIDHKLMTSRFGGLGSEIAKTKAWLEGVLATERARNAKFRVLVVHFALWMECWGTQIDNPGNLETAATAGGIDLVLSGHMHGYERIFKSDIMQVTNGGAGQLDHAEKVELNYGDATVVGGHKDLPYLWARQKSASENDVLGPAEPVRMGCLQCYGEIKVDGNVLTYTTHAFNADGSYIGVCDEFALTSKTCVATSPAPTAGAICADPSAFAEFTAKPVSNAAWKNYKDAVGETFTFAEGEGEKPVVNVSKVEIEKFLAWLNGASGTYRLPTASELETALAENLRRDVAEWSSSVDPVTGWCRILGSPAVAAEWVWSRTADKPCIATAGCHANYLGFRLATGTQPEETVDASSLDAALVALAQVPNPAEVYKWENGALVDVSADWTSPSGDIAYSVPVIFTGSGALNYDLGSYNAVLDGGFAAPNTLSLTKSGSGALTVGGEVRGGGIGWYLASGGALGLDGASSGGPYVRFRSGDGALGLAGESDFASSEVPVETGDCSRYVASGGSTTFRAKAMVNKNSSGGVSIGEGVTVALNKDFQFGGTYDLAVNGVLEAEALNMLVNKDPWVTGNGTVRTGHLGTYGNSWIRLAVSNIVFTSANPIQSNSAQNYTSVFLGGPEMHFSPTCDVSVNATDNFGKPVYILADASLDTCAKLVVEGPHDIVYAPYSSVSTSNNTTKENNSPYGWGMEMAGTGSLAIKTKVKGDVVAGSGTVKVYTTPCEGAVSVAAGATLAVAESGTVALGGNLSLADGAILGFNFTERTERPVLDLTDKTVTASGAIKVAVGGVWPKVTGSARSVALTSGGAFAGVSNDDVSLVAEGRPAWAKSVVVENGDIVLNVKPMSTMVIVK